MRTKKLTDFIWIIGVILSLGCTQNKATEVDASADFSRDEENFVMVGGAKMLPSKDLLNNIGKSKIHTHYLAALQATGEFETLSKKGPFTVFAPTDLAFAQLPKTNRVSLFEPENKKKLQKVLNFHVVNGALEAKDLHDGQTLKTLQGENLTVHIVNGKVLINNVVVVLPDVISNNGIAHIIDGVLLPDTTKLRRSKYRDY